MHSKIIPNYISVKIKLFTISPHLSKQSKLQKRFIYMSPLYFVLRCTKKFFFKFLLFWPFFLIYLLFRHFFLKKNQKKQIALKKLSLFNAIWIIIFSFSIYVCLCMYVLLTTKKNSNEAKQVINFNIAPYHLELFSKKI